MRAWELAAARDRSRTGRRTNCADELHLDARVLEALAILGPHRDLALDRLAIEVQRDLLFAVLVELDVDGGAVVEVLEDDVDVDGGGEEVGHGERGCFRRPGAVVVDAMPVQRSMGWRSMVGGRHLAAEGVP
jgi:hypothetical protein